MSAGTNITVAVRVRPLSSKEAARGAHACIVVQDSRQVNVVDPDDKMGGIDYLRLDKTKDKSYAFDHAFDESVPQEKVFRSTSLDLIGDVIRGCNATCFAYGATGSGKTYTMMGDERNPGVIPRTVDALFKAIRDASEDHSFAVKMSYIEIYNEQIKDLLAPTTGALDVREAPGKGTFVAGVSNLSVESRQELESLIHKGGLYRTTEATNCNEVSSRSHAVLQLRVESTPRFESKRTLTVGKLSMIDLAGSERAKKVRSRELHACMHAGRRHVTSRGRSVRSRRTTEASGSSRGRTSTARCSRSRIASTRSRTR